MITRKITVMEGGIALGKITIDEIQSKVAAKGQTIDYSVNLFRGKTKQQGWTMKRTRPRDPDEIKALNYISRQKLRNALKEGTIIYDKERRVLSFDEYSGSPIEKNEIGD